MSEFLLHDEPVKQVYLDANATTPVLPCIAYVVSHTMQICFGNPSSPHITGIQAKHLLEQTRQKAHTVIGASNGDILAACLVCEWGYAKHICSSVDTSVS